MGGGMDGELGNLSLSEIGKNAGKNLVLLPGVYPIGEAEEISDIFS